MSYMDIENDFDNDTQTLQEWRKVHCKPRKSDFERFVILCQPVLLWCSIRTYKFYRKNRNG